VFFHESCIYLDVTFDLLKKGFNVWQQYDCWYTNKEVSNIEQIVEQYVMQYVNRNRSNNNNNITIVKIFAEHNVDIVKQLVEESLSGETPEMILNYKGDNNERNLHEH
jgi:hypothetical protein